MLRFCILKKYFMKKIVEVIAVVLCLSVYSNMAFAQEVPAIDTTEATPVKCLSEHRHYISLNVLQFATGTANLNYEVSLFAPLSLKLGVGTVMGTRILFNESQQPCMPGGFYGMISPRWYPSRASKACLIQYGVGLSYKYWNYTGEEHYSSIKDLTAKGEDIETYKKDDNYNVTDSDVYKKEDVVEHLGGLYVLGKGGIASGLTIEFELGFGLGVKSDDFYFTPNLGMSFGWTFGKKKSAE